MAITRSLTTRRRSQNAEDFKIRRTYIQQNPVRANLVSSAELYPFSSAFKSIPA
jgi:hypothetical protein